MTQRSTLPEESALFICIRQWCETYNRRHAYLPHRIAVAVLSIIAAIFLFPEGPFHVPLVYAGSVTTLSIALWRPALRVALLPRHASVPDDLLLTIAHSDAISAPTKSLLGSELRRRGYIDFETLFREARIACPCPGYDALAHGSPRPRGEP